MRYKISWNIIFDEEQEADECYQVLLRYAQKKNIDEPFFEELDK